jgi:hypothetical protein
MLDCRGNALSIGDVVELKLSHSVFNCPMKVLGLLTDELIVHRIAFFNPLYNCIDYISTTSDSIRHFQVVKQDDIDEMQFRMTLPYD